jgi:hypothetical protein
MSLKSPIQPELGKTPSGVDIEEFRKRFFDPDLWKKTQVQKEADAEIEQVFPQAERVKMLAKLKSRFETNYIFHQGMKWGQVQVFLQEEPSILYAAYLTDKPETPVQVYSPAYYEQKHDNPYFMDRAIIHCSGCFFIG